MALVSFFIGKQYLPVPMQSWNILVSDLEYKYDAINLTRMV